MELLESEWFFRMVEHQGKTPGARLIAIFTVVDHWISAPGIKERLTPQHSVAATSRLKTYLIDTAKSAKAGNPAMLASQLLILLQGAISEELREPGINALENAAMAAQAVVARSCQSSRQKRLGLLSAVASLAIAVAVAVLWQLHPLAQNSIQDASRVAIRHAPYIQTVANMPMGVNPSDMEAALSLQEKFDRGICPAPHLMVLPQGQMTAYMNVIHFQTPEDAAADRANLHAFLVWFNESQATECYYAPSNGHTLATWR